MVDVRTQKKESLPNGKLSLVYMCLLCVYSLFTAIEIIDAYKVSREGFQCDKTRINTSVE